MLLLKLVVLAQLAFGFKNSSPFLLLSYNKDTFKGEQSSILSSDEILSLALSGLDSCSADAYILVNQNGLHSSDFASSNSAPHLFSLIKSAGSVLAVKNVVESSTGESFEASLSQFLIDDCNAKPVHVDSETGAFETYIDSHPRVIDLNFKPLPLEPEARSKALLRNDNILFSVMSLLPSPNYIVIFASTPLNDEQYDSLPAKSVSSKSEDLSEGLNKDFLPSFEEVNPSVTAASTSTSLFASYAFFSPAAFMGIIIGLIFLGILYTALSWISSLQVSYKAFEKPPQIPGTGKAQ